MEEVQETQFLNEKGVTVTSSRFILPSQTFAMSGITSVKSAIDKPSKVFPIILIIIGVIMMAGGGDSLIYGVVVVIFGGVWVAVLKTTYHVVLTTASGEAKALSSKDQNWVGKIILSLNDAIVHRG